MDFIYVFSFSASFHEKERTTTGGSLFPTQLFAPLPLRNQTEYKKEDKCLYHNIFIGFYLLHKMNKKCCSQDCFLSLN